MALHSIAAWISRRNAELRLATRITVAGLAAYVLAHSLNLPQGYWAVFTAVLVVQGSVGGSYKAALDRLIGTLGGALYGAAVATLVPHTSVVALGFALAVSLAPLAMLAAVSVSFRVAPVTAIILLLGSVATQDPPFLAALYRALEVLLGGVVGLAVSLLVLPAHAHHLVGDAARVVAAKMAGLLVELMDGLVKAPLDGPAISARHDAIQSAFDRLETTIQEANRERSILLTNEDDPEAISRTLRRVYHDLVLIGRVAAQPLPAAMAATASATLDRSAQALAAFLRAAGEALASRSPPPPLGEVTEVLAECENEFDAIQKSPANPDMARLLALDFAFTQLARNLGDLSERIGEFARPRRQ